MSLPYDAVATREWVIGIFEQSCAIPAALQMSFFIILQGSKRCPTCSALVRRRNLVRLARSQTQKQSS